MLNPGWTMALLLPAAWAGSVATTTTAVAPETNAAEPAVPTRSFEIVASRFRFEPDHIEVAQGDRVVLKLRSADTVHGLGIKRFKVKVEIPKSGETVTAEFVANKVGRFPFSCSEYCGKGHKQMKGTLVVKPRKRR